jgi:SH3-like domain-containing protein
MQMRATAAAALCCAALMSTTPASAWCIKVPEANLRHGPGTNYEKSWEVFKYMPLKKIGEKGSWYHMQDVDGDEHWVYSKLLTNGMRCAVVKVETANVRTGPGTNYKASPLSPVEKYYAFKIVESRGDWVKVEDEVLNEGWVYKPLLWIQ